MFHLECTLMNSKTIAHHRTRHCQQLLGVNIPIYHQTNATSRFTAELNLIIQSLLKRLLGVLTCVGWQVTLCDPIWQVTLRSCEMVLHEQLYQLYLYLTLSAFTQPSIPPG